MTRTPSTPDARIGAPSTAAKRFVAGSMLAGRFRYVDRLGKGAMGEVYKAEDVLLGLPVALKLLPREKELDPRSKQMLLEELKVARLIADDHVCRLWDVGQHIEDGKKLHFITMELIRGDTVDTLLARFGRFPEEKVVTWALQLCQGLAAIHGKGVLHRDFKPGNVMIDSKSRARITDFGLASPASAARDTGMIVGTPAYMAPEQLAGSTLVESDLYAFALVLYEMLTGSRPVAVPSGSVGEVVRRLRELRRSLPPPPSERMRIEHPRLEETILRGLDPRPQRRFRSAQQMAAFLGGEVEWESKLGPEPGSLGASWDVSPSDYGSRRGDPVAAWLECLADDHKNLLPFFEHGETVLLDEVYVELRMHERAMVAGGEHGLFGLPVSLPTLLKELDPTKDRWSTGRWLLRGDPGAGKTTLLRHFASSLARDEKRRWVPLFASLPRWLRGTGDFLEQADVRLGHRGFASGALRKALDALAEKGRLLLLLDGLDEVPRESRDEVAGVLRDLDQRWRKTPIVVTTRPIGGFVPGERFKELDLLPFDHRQRQRFLRGWLERTARRGGKVGRGEQEAAGTVYKRLFGREAEPMTPEACVAALDALLDEDRGLRELAGNPLYLTLMALLFESGDHPAHHRTQLYDQVFELLFEGGHRLGGEPLPNRVAAQAALGFLAYGMTLDNRDAESFGALEERLLVPEAAKLRRRLAAEERWQRPLVFLEDVAHHTGILGPHDGPRADWRFWHRTFREALAATELQRRGEGAALGQAKTIAGDEGRWAEPYALYAGRLDTPDELVCKLVRANRALGLRAVATVQGLGADTLDQVLELTDDVAARDKVYARLPEMVGDGERALALLERLRRRQRAGAAELCFLHRATGEIADRWSHLAEPARQFRARLFEHIPTPPPGLFDTVETPRDGVVPLWCEIPAGTFWMGSPEGETGRFDRETWHRVEIKAPLAMAAVPVTNAQYAAFASEHAWHAWSKVSPQELASHPAVNVSWHAATAFCLWLGSLPGLEGVRLPTEAEWEYACRAGTTTRYWSGNKDWDLGRVGWYWANSRGRTHRVGEKPANAWGLYDVHGNVREWCADWHGTYPAEVVTDPTGPTKGSYRVFRGGSWTADARAVRAAYRHSYDPGNRLWNLGLRVARGQEAPGAEPK